MTRQLRCVVRASRPLTSCDPGWRRAAALRCVSCRLVIVWTVLTARYAGDRGDKQGATMHAELSQYTAHTVSALHVLTESGSRRDELSALAEN